MNLTEQPEHQHMVVPVNHTVGGHAQRGAHHVTVMIQAALNKSLSSFSRLDTR
jgi:hypothetical protein